MNRKFLLNFSLWQCSVCLIFSLWAFAGCEKQKTADYTFTDTRRNRTIPVTVYLPEEKSFEDSPKVVIFSHGYGENTPGSNRAYSYINENLAAHGFIVASIQHELPTDELLPLTGIPQVVRMPNWQRGSENILFVRNEMKKHYPHADFSRLTIMGHSNGGDMSVLFAHQHPELVWKLITLDQRRMAFPRVTSPKIYSLRSSDQPADEGVLPTQEEQSRLGITIIKLENTTHNQMDDDANEAQRKEINDLVLKFLKEGE
ncbi:MAG: alpha/beta hydrolase [Bacteroidia bacterium]|nr:alpha/beta hydrolase [Bacteroidia bacterium]